MFQFQKDSQRSVTAVKRPYAKYAVQDHSETLRSSGTTWEKDITWAPLILLKAPLCFWTQQDVRSVLTYFQTGLLNHDLKHQVD